MPHLQSKQDSRDIPLLVGDYGFIRDSDDQDCTTTLVLKLYPFKLFFSCVVAAKGPDTMVVTRLAQFIKDAGLTHFAYRSDREPAIMAMIEEACARSGRRGVWLVLLVSSWRRSCLFSRACRKVILVIESQVRARRSL